jgi:L-ascorbate metabolism protein UlaG (beta-lactamase superfamily)
MRCCRYRWAFAAFLICRASLAAAPATRPVSFTGWDEDALRRGAMKELKRFAEEFHDRPPAGDALRLVDQDEQSTDPHAWIAGTLDWADRALKTAPPSDENDRIRRAILLIVDYPLHVDRMYIKGLPKYGPEWAAAVGKYFQKAVGPAINQIAAAKVERGLDIWKIYNMGFVVRSRNHCIGFDIHPGSVQDAYALSDKQQKLLIDRLEVLFISHWHFDHLNERFVRRMLSAGKKVVVPTPVRTDLNQGPVVRLYDLTDRPTDIGGIKVYAFPGWQSRTTPVGVYAVNLDGYWVSHNGDNRRTEIYSEIPKRCAVDVLLANCWSGFDAYAKATRPKLMITGHENELGHAAGGRRPFREMFGILDRMKDPPKSRILQWGEHIHWEP